MSDLPLCQCGCGNRVKKSGNRFRRGHHRLGLHLQGSLEDRFWSRVNKTPTCWLWTGEITNKGYGRITLDHHHKVRRYEAHRLAWEWLRGPIPPGMNVCHNCPGGDNPACVNPDHLFLGTQSDNIQDCLAKGRHVSQVKLETYARGSNHGKAVLNEQDIRYIRTMQGVLSGPILAKQLRCSNNTIYNIWSKKTWKHIS